uniref:Large ribosomal subunit protein bL33m n=1 Tax=Sus scrofa TaxID=9823 RepID=A0A8D1W8T9_PIG
MFLSAVTFAKSKSKTILVKMMSQAGTGFSFNTKRSRLREKLTLLHYDPVAKSIHYKRMLWGEPPGGRRSPAKGFCPRSRLAIYLPGKCQSILFLRSEIRARKQILCSLTLKIFFKTLFNSVSWVIKVLYTWASILTRIL